MHTTPVYARLDDEAFEWLNEQQQSSKISKARIINALVLDAKRRGYAFHEVKPAIEVEHPR